MSGAIFVCALLAVGCNRGGGVSAECQPLADAITAAQAVADPSESVRAGIAAAVAAPPAVAGPCTVTLPVNHGQAVIAIGELATYEPSRVASLAGSLNLAEIHAVDCELLSEDERTQTIADLQAGAEALSTGYDIVMVEQRRVAAELTGNGTFAPGMLTAQMFVWSYADQAVVCVGTATATNRAEVSTSEHRTNQAYLNDDLDLQFANAARPALLAVQ